MPTEKNIKPPEKLLEYFNKYKKKCKESPKKETLWSYKSDKEVSISKEIPLTWGGFEIYLRTKKILVKLDDYKSNKEERYSEYAGVIRAIDQEIYEDKYTGAVAGIFQNNIIARDLGLIDQQAVKNTGAQSVIIESASPEEEKANEKTLKDIDEN